MKASKMFDDVLTLIMIIALFVIFPGIMFTLVIGLAVVRLVYVGICKLFNFTIKEW
jgi:hypothetical protein